MDAKKPKKHSAEAAEIEHSLFNYPCFCYMCRGLNRPPRTGKKPDPVDTGKSYEENFPTLEDSLQGMSLALPPAPLLPGQAMSTKAKEPPNRKTKTQENPDAIPSTSAEKGKFKKSVVIPPAPLLPGLAKLTEVKKPPSRKTKAQEKPDAKPPTSAKKGKFKKDEINSNGSSSESPFESFNRFSVLAQEFPSEAEVSSEQNAESSKGKKPSKKKQTPDERRAAIAESMRKNRAKKTDTEKAAEAEANCTRNAEARQNMSEDMQAAQAEANRTRKAEARQNMSEDMQVAQAEDNRTSKAKGRQNMSEDKQSATKATDRKRKAEKSPDRKAAQAEARKQNKARKKESHLDAAKLPDNYPEGVTPVEPFRVGRFNKVCRDCGAYMLAGEAHRGSLGLPHEPGNASFNLCCSYGKNMVEPLQEPPDYLQELLTGVPASAELELAYQKECTKRMPVKCYSTAEKRHYTLDPIPEGENKGQFTYTYIGPVSKFFNSQTGEFNRDTCSLNHEHGKYTRTYLTKKSAYADKCMENRCQICTAVDKMGAKACHQCSVDEAVRLIKVEANDNGRLGILLPPSTDCVLSQCRGHGVVDACNKDPNKPHELKKLLKACRQDGNHFRTNIRKYNNVLSFASKGFTGKHFQFRTKRGPPCFKISGRMYHNMTNVLPNEGQNPQFSQMYVYDEQQELDSRMEHGEGLDPTIVQKLQQMMHESNPLVAEFQTAAQQMKDNPTVDIQMVIKSKTSENVTREYRSPVVEVVGMVVPVRADNDLRNPRDVVLYRNQDSHPDGNKTVRISTTHPCYDTAAYPIMHPRGEMGFELGLKQKPEKDTDKLQKLSELRYYQNRLMSRDHHFSTLHHCGRLLQEYCCDMWSKVEGERLKWIEHNQSQLRAEVLEGLTDALEKESDESSIGKEIRMPASFVTSPRWTYANYLDSLAIARKYKKFSWFITNTCNPKAQDIVAEIDTWNMFLPNDRPDVMDRVYKLQMQEFHKELETLGVMGEPTAYVDVFEQQMRALWHCHNSLLTKDIVTESEVDDWVSAQIPDKAKDPIYYQMVIDHMLHGPCGEHNPNSPCMGPNKDGQKACKAGYPKPTVEKTYLQPNGYPAYKRPKEGPIAVKNGFPFDSRWVVPHNRYLLLRYGSHINVEYTASLGTLRYQFKYMNKGNDLTTVKLMSKEDGQGRNEIDEFVNARYIDAHLAMWRMIDGPIVSRFPAVVRLAVHEEGKQFVTFKPGQAKATVEDPKGTTLTAWLAFNRDNANHRIAKETTYLEFPEKFVFNHSTKMWKARANIDAIDNGDEKVSCIGRLNAVTRSSDDRYYLRMLLHHQKGCKTFEDIRTVQDQIHDTYKAAAFALGLLMDDNEHVYALDEAWHSGKSAERLRNLFAIQLVHCEISNPVAIYDAFKDFLFDDIMHDMGDAELTAHAEIVGLGRLDDILQDMGSSLAEFPDLPQPDIGQIPLEETRAFRREQYDIEEQKLKLEPMMELLQQNPEQLAIFECVKNALSSTL